MERRADLHIHTTASDGCLTPAQAVAAAAQVGLAAVAVTDHDTVDGLDEAIAAGNSRGVEVVAGVEISAVYAEWVDVHVLGYMIDHRSKSLVEALTMLKDARRERGRRMVEQLNEAGVPVRFERVEELARGGAIGRPHVARALCEIGAASSMDAAFGRFLQEGGPGYVPRYKISPTEALNLILSAGGVACLAHAAKLGREELVAQLVEQGMEALEVYHPDHTAAAVRFYRKFAAARGLIATGGSDAHCFDAGSDSGIGSVTVPYEVVEQLRQAAEAGR